MLSRSARRRQQKLQLQIADGRRHDARSVLANVSVHDLPSTNSGWSGQDFRRRYQKDDILRRWKNGTIVPWMTDLEFQRIPFDG